MVGRKESLNCPDDNDEDDNRVTIHKTVGTRPMYYDNTRVRLVWKVRTYDRRIVYSQGSSFTARRVIFNDWDLRESRTSCCCFWDSLDYTRSQEIIDETV